MSKKPDSKTSTVSATVSAMPSAEAAAEFKSIRREAQSSDSVVLAAPAKINLHLRVGSRRSDGFHPLMTWMTTVGLADTLRMTLTENGRVGMSCDDPTLPCDERNLVVRASKSLGGGRLLLPSVSAPGKGADADAARSNAAGFNAARLNAAQFNAAPSDAAPSRAVAVGDARPSVGNVEFSLTDAEKVSPPAQSFLSNSPSSSNSSDSPSSIRSSSADLSASIHLNKRIPAGAGLGGGSSDAAFTLVGLNRLWNLELSVSDLADRAASLGSDVPFFLYGPSSVCRGRGEAVRPIAVPVVAKWVVLILPDIMMPTADVYRKFDDMQLGFDSEVDAEPDWSQWCQLSSQELLPLLVNDLEAPAFALRPDLNQLRVEIERQLGRIVRMSGSGSSLFTLFDLHDQAVRAAEIVTQRHRVRASAVEMCPLI